MLRRTLIAATLAAPAIARAQSWPTAPVRLLVPFSAGGPTDLPARLIADELSKSFGQRFVVENRTGSGVIVASDAVAKAPKDGQTLLYTTVGHAVARALFPHLPFDPIADFQPVAHIGRIHNVVMVNKDVPAKTLPELLLAMAGGLDVAHVAYRGSTAAMPDLLSGHVAMMLDVISSGLPFIQKGETRGLAITAAQRSPLFPDLPTVAETIPGDESFTWHMVLAPAGTPPATVALLNAAINKVVADPRHRATLQGQGMDVVSDSTPASSAAFLQAEITKWEAVIQKAGIKAS